ncbi:MAG: hypothetical protein ACO3RV_07740 [Luteolibacter sp.]
MSENPREHGSQPLVELMEKWGISNHHLVASSLEQLTHKQVQRARKGRQLTLHLMQKITRALNQVILSELNDDARKEFVPYLHKHLFNYAKGHDPEWRDPNP